MKIRLIKAINCGIPNVAFLKSFYIGFERHLYSIPPIFQLGYRFGVYIFFMRSKC